jgi:leader peptidase (prepilin peptidase)/N-methyltransferase
MTLAAFTDPWALACLAVLTICLVWLSVVDLKTGYLPDPLQIALAVAGLGVAVVGSPIGVTWKAALLGAGINGGVFWGLRWLVSRLKGREAMGFGDVKLVAAGGLWLGPLALAYIMAAGGILTLLGAGIVGVATQKPVWRGEMPLGPGLAAGILGVFIAALAGVSWLMLVPPALP